MIDEFEHVAAARGRPNCGARVLEGWRLSQRNQMRTRTGRAARGSARRNWRQGGRLVLLVPVLALVWVLHAGPAWSLIELPKNKSVTERPRPDYDPLGIRAGAFTIVPRIEIGESYNDNIFAEDTGEVDDLITVVHPSLTVKSDTSNHSLRLEADARVGLHADRSDEDYEDFKIAAIGRIDVLRNSRLFGALAYRALHEDRSSADDPNGKEPVEYDTASVMVGGVHAFNRLSLRLDGRFTNLDFDDTTTAAGVNIDQDDRDRALYAMSLRAAYELAPEYDVFVRGTYNFRDYDDALDKTGLNRDSDGYDMVVGATADFTGVTFGEIFAGYLSQDYDDAQLPTVDGFKFGATVTWNPSLLTTVKGWVERLVNETTQVGVSGVLHSALGVSVDHELLRQFLLHAELAYANQDYEGSARDDDLLSAALSAKYMLNRNYFLAAAYRLERRDSTQAGQDFDQNLFTVRLGLQY